MKAYRLLLAALIGFSLSSCSSPDVVECEVCEVCEICEVCEVCPENPFPEGLVLPQIHIQGKLFWTTNDLDMLKTNVTDPIIAYFEEQEFTVVSISVTTNDLSAASINTILVEVIVSDNDGNQNPHHMGVLIEKVDGVFPVWQQEDIGP